MNLETNSVPTSCTTMQIIKKILMQPEVAKNYYRFLKRNDGNIMVNKIYQSDLGKNMCYPTLQKTLVRQKILQLKNCYFETNQSSH